MKLVEKGLLISKQFPKFKGFNMRLIFKESMVFSMNNLKIATFIGEEDLTAPEYKIESFPITNPLAVEMAQKILEENEGDYLCGFLSLIYNNVVIFGEEQITESLLDTWSSLSNILESRYDGSKEEINFLDNYPYYYTTIQEIDQFYEIQLDRNQRFFVPIEPFRNEVKREFFAFMEFCKNLQFSEESSYRGLLETYEELIQNEKEKT
ncbi:hypothetical protein [Lysinibacillus sp. FSL W8-0992]|uniref:hypothetical protein n=1 Tax=Lysinibacillus sp. FSL W8-0992 TaxID=2954643 RepID=UPI0030FAF52E